MADATDEYKKADVMNKLGDEVKQMIEDKKKMIDPNHRNDVTESDISSDEEHAKEGDFTFVSALDVGSHFIDVDPSNELIFNPFEQGVQAHGLQRRVQR